jgi:hypothetical protein
MVEMPWEYSDHPLFMRVRNRFQGEISSVSSGYVFVLLMADV